MRYLGTSYATALFQCMHCGRDMTVVYYAERHADVCEAVQTLRQYDHYREYNTHLKEYVLR